MHLQLMREKGKSDARFWEKHLFSRVATDTVSPALGLECRGSGWAAAGFL